MGRSLHKPPERLWPPVCTMSQTVPGADTISSHPRIPAGTVISKACERISSQTVFTMWSSLSHLEGMRLCLFQVF